MKKTRKIMSIICTVNCRQQTVLKKSHAQLGLPDKGSTIKQKHKKKYRIKGKWYDILINVMLK